MNILKRIFKIVMVLFLILFVAITIFFLTFDLNSYKGIITSKASDALGRPVTIESMSMKLSLIPTVEIKGVKIVNNDAFKDEPSLLEIDSVDATLALLPLLSSKVEIESFNMATAKVNLFSKNGQNNYTLGASKDVVEEKMVTVEKVSDKQIVPDDIFKNVANVLNRLRIDTIKIKSLLITHIKDDKKQSLALVDVAVDQLKLIKMTLIYNGKVVNAEVNLGDFTSFVSRRPNYSFSAVFKAFDSELEVSGTIGDTVNFKDLLFNLSIEGTNLKKVVDNFIISDKIPAKPYSLKMIAKGDFHNQLKIQPLTMILGDNDATLSMDMTLYEAIGNVQIAVVADAQISDSKLANTYFIKPMSISIDATGDKKNLVLNKLMLSGGKSDLVMNGLVSLSDEKVPTVKTQIVSRYFELSDFIFEPLPEVETQKQKTEQVKKTMFSDEKIDLTFLKKANVEFAATAQYVKVPQIDNIGMALSGNLTNGVLTVPSLTFRTLAGVVKGNGSLNASQMPAKAQLEIQSDELNLDSIKPIAEQVQGAHVLTKIKLSAQGDSLKSFVNELDGQVLLEVTQGEILNKWFNSLPLAIGALKDKDAGMNFNVTEQNSDLVCGAVNLAIKKGVISSDNQIAVETSVVDFAISGDINLPKEELSLTMVPSISNAKSTVQDALTLTKMVKVTGPLAEPSFSVDTKAAVQTAVKSGLNALVNKVAQKQGVNLSTEQRRETLHLCEKVLGRPLIGQTTMRVVAPVLKKEEVVIDKKTSVDKKDEIKKQLLDTLTKALKQ